MTVSKVAEVQRRTDLPLSHASSALRDRLADVLESTGDQFFRQATTSGSWDAPPDGMADIDYQLFFHYELKEPRHLLLRTIRRLILWPLFRRQVEFNASVRNAVLQLWRERNELRRTIDETNRRLGELERAVLALSQEKDR